MEHTPTTTLERQLIARAAGTLRTGQQWAELAHPMARAGLKKPLLRCAFCGRGGWT